MNIKSESQVKVQKSHCVLSYSIKVKVMNISVDIGFFHYNNGTLKEEGRTTAAGRVH